MPSLRRVQGAVARVGVPSKQGDHAPLLTNRRTRRCGLIGACATAVMVAGLTLVFVVGCGRSGPMPPQDAAQHLARVWQALLDEDSGSFEQAMAALKTVPPEAFRAAVYTLQSRPAGRDVVMLDQTPVTADPAWFKRTAASFLEHYARERPPDEVLQQWERLDALMEGVLRSAKTWTARYPSGQLPEALPAVSGLQQVLATNMLKSAAVADRPGSRERLERRLREIDETYWELSVKLVTQPPP